MYKTGIEIFSKLTVKYGEKVAIKIGISFFDIFPIIGELIN